MVTRIALWQGHPVKYVVDVLKLLCYINFSFSVYA